MKRAYTTAFAVCFALYSIGPLLAVPAWAYVNRNWWMLFGIPVSYLFSFLSTFGAKFIAMFCILAAGAWMGGVPFDVRTLPTFLFISALYGHVFYQAADAYDEARKKEPT